MVSSASGVGRHAVAVVEQVGHPDLPWPPSGLDRGLDRPADVVGVDVAVPQPVAADDDDGVADAAPRRPEAVDPLVRQVEEVHDLVAQVGDPTTRLVMAVMAVMAGRSSRARPVGAVVVGLGQRATIDDVEGRVEQQQEAGSSRIHDAGGLQHREQVGCVVQRLLRPPPRRGEDVEQRAALPRDARRRAGGLSDHGEDGALDGPQDGGVGGRGGGAERGGHHRGIDLVRVLEGEADAPEDLAEDHARVASRPHERAVRDGAAGGHQLGRHAFHLDHDGVERAGHVGAGVAVGHGIDVEAVEPRGVGPDGVAVRRDRVADGEHAQPLEGGHAGMVPRPR